MLIKELSSGTVYVTGDVVAGARKSLYLKYCNELFALTVISPPTTGEP